MRKIDDKHVECNGKVYTIARSRGGATCTICSCVDCRLNGRIYSATCYKLIGNEYYLRR